MSKVFSCKLTDGIAAQFSVYLGSQGMSANAFFSDYVRSTLAKAIARSEATAPSLPPPIPGIPIATAPSLNNTRPLVDLMKGLGVKAIRGGGVYSLSEEEKATLVDLLNTYHLPAPAAEQNLYDLANKAYEAGKVESVDDFFWGCISAVEEDLPALGAFGVAK